MTKKVLIVDESERTGKEIGDLLNDGLFFKGIIEDIEYVISDNSGFLSFVNSSNGTLEDVSLCITDNINVVEYSQRRNIPTLFYFSGDNVTGKRAVEMGADWIRKSFFMSPLYLAADSIKILFGKN